MNKGQKHSDETKKKISENTKKAMKSKPLNKTAFKPGNIPWNAGLKGVMGVNSGSFQPVPIGTIRIRKNNGYEYQWIKTEKGWEKYWPNGKPEKKNIQKPIKVATPKKESEIKVSEIVEAPKPILTQAERKRIQREQERELKLQQEIERKKQAQREWFAQFGITNPVIRVELRRAEE